MLEPDVLILSSPRHDEIVTKSSSCPHTVHLAVDRLALAFHLQLSPGFLEHVSSFGRKRPSCFCTVSGVLAEGTPLWKHTACLGARQGKAASLPRPGLRAHPPQQSSGFLPPLPPPLWVEELLSDLGPFLKVAARVTPLSAQPTCRATSSPGFVRGRPPVLWTSTRLGMGIRISTPCQFSLGTTGPARIGPSKGAVTWSRCQERDL